MKKVIKLTESDLFKIVKKIILEQTKFKTNTLKPEEQKKYAQGMNRMQQVSKQQPVTQNTPIKSQSVVKTYDLNLNKYTCTTPEISTAAVSVISEGFDPLYVKYAIGIIGRESDFGKVMGMYGIKAAPEYLMNKLSDTIPGFSEVLKYGAKKVFNKDNWVPSMGIAQMTPDIAKKYGVDLEELMSLSGSLLAVTKHLINLYEELTPYYDSKSPSKIINQGQLIDNPSSSNNSVMDAAIMSYNLGSSRFKKKYCKTNNPEFMAPCDSINGVYQPFPKDKPDLVLKVDKNQVIKNYIPNIKTDTTTVTQKAINLVSDEPTIQYISSLGYLKEVVNTAKSLSCIK
jgi:hypothetical protein